MKKVRLTVLAVLAAFCGLCIFSYVSGLESGENAPYLAVLGILSGIATAVLAKAWDKKGKLPEEVTDRRRDAA